MHGYVCLCVSKGLSGGRYSSPTVPRGVNPMIYLIKSGIFGRDSAHPSWDASVSPHAIDGVDRDPGGLPLMSEGEPEIALLTGHSPRQTAERPGPTA